MASVKGECAQGSQTLAGAARRDQESSGIGDLGLFHIFLRAWPPGGGLRSLTLANPAYFSGLATVTLFQIRLQLCRRAVVAERGASHAV
jgi:hypothetical protein